MEIFNVSAVLKELMFLQVIMHLNVILVVLVNIGKGGIHIVTLVRQMLIVMAQQHSAYLDIILLEEILITVEILRLAILYFLNLF